MNDSAEALDMGELDNAKTEMAVAVADIDTCRNGCKGLTGRGAVALLRKNELVGKLCANALAIMNRVRST